MLKYLATEVELNLPRFLVLGHVYSIVCGILYTLGLLNN